MQGQANPTQPWCWATNQFCHQQGASTAKKPVITAKTAQIWRIKDHRVWEIKKASSRVVDDIGSSFSKQDQQIS